MKRWSKKFILPVFHKLWYYLIICQIWLGCNTLFRTYLLLQFQKYCLIVFFCWSSSASNRWCVLTVCDVSSLSPQAALRRKELEQSLQWAQENDKTLRQIQESLANTDRHLTAYLADHIDAQQIPQEAQVAMLYPHFFLFPITATYSCLCPNNLS